MPPQSLPARLLSQFLKTDRSMPPCLPSLLSQGEVNQLYPPRQHHFSTGLRPLPGPLPLYPLPPSPLRALEKDDGVGRTGGHHGKGDKPQAERKVVHVNPLEGFPPRSWTRGKEKRREW